MKYGFRTPDLGKSIAAKLSINRMLKQQLGFGKGLLPNRKKSKYNKKYSKNVKKMKDMKANEFTSRSGRIEHIQSILKKAGMYKGKLTGILDNNTIKAVKLFQKKHNINPTGLLDFKTLIELDKVKSNKQNNKEQR